MKTQSLFLLVAFFFSIGQSFAAGEAYCKVGPNSSSCSNSEAYCDKNSYVSPGSGSAAQPSSTSSHMLQDFKPATGPV